MSVFTLPTLIMLLMGCRYVANVIQKETRNASRKENILDLEFVCPLFQGDSFNFSTVYQA